jgi:hypothetical protein
MVMHKLLFRVPRNQGGGIAYFSGNNNVISHIMSTLLNRTFLITLSIIICVSSCGQKVSHKEALDYCVQIQLQMKDAKANLENSWNELVANVKIAQQNPNQKL